MKVLKLMVLLVSLSSIAAYANGPSDYGHTGDCSNKRNTPLVMALRKLDNQHPADLSKLIIYVRDSRGAVSEQYIRASLSDYGVSDAATERLVREVKSAQNLD